MKKFFAMMMCVIMVFGLVACDSNPGVSIPEGGIFTQPEETTVMSREDAVKKVETKFDLISGEYRHLVDPNVTQDDSDPVITVLVVDHCGEMDLKLSKQIFLAILSYKEHVHDDEYAGIVWYDSTPHIEFPISKWSLDIENECGRLLEDFLERERSNGSAMFDAIIVGLKMLVDAQEYAPSATLNLILLSNGRLDMSSRNSESRIENIAPIAAGLGVHVYTIAYATEGSDYKRLEGLQTLAENTGAKYFEVEVNENIHKGLPVVVADLVEEVCNR